MHTQVRAATAADADAVRELEHAARTALADQRGGAQLLREQPAVTSWPALIGDDRSRVFVAAIDGVLVGYLEVGLGGRVATIRQVYVDPEARELGFGDDMLDLAIDAARRDGAEVMEGFALPGDRDTKNLFERAGITARKIIVSRPISDLSRQPDASPRTP